MHSPLSMLNASLLARWYISGCETKPSECKLIALPVLRSPEATARFVDLGEGTEGEGTPVRLGSGIKSVRSPVDFAASASKRFSSLVVEESLGMVRSRLEALHMATAGLLLMPDDRSSSGLHPAAHSSFKVQRLRVCLQIWHFVVQLMCSCLRFLQILSDIGDVTEVLYRDIAGLKTKRDANQLDFNSKSTAWHVRMAESQHSQEQASRLVASTERALRLAKG